MQQHSQPDFPTPRITYGGRRMRLHTAPWVTDQGVPNDADPNPDQPDLRIPEHKPRHERIRPPIWKRGDEEEVPFSPCIYRVTVSAVTDDGAGQTIYLRQNASPVVYYGHTSEGGLAFTGNNPPACTGGGIAAVVGLNLILSSFPTTFTAWWNWSNHACGPSFDSSVFQIINGGTCDIKVNGTLIVPTMDMTQSGLAEAPTAGDAHTFLGGTVFTVTLP